MRNSQDSRRSGIGSEGPKKVGGGIKEVALARGLRAEGLSKAQMNRINCKTTWQASNSHFSTSRGRENL